MKYHTDNHIGELRAVAENGKIIYYEDARPKKKGKKNERY